MLGGIVALPHWYPWWQCTIAAVRPLPITGGHVTFSFCPSADGRRRPVKVRSWQYGGGRIFHYHHSETVWVLKERRAATTEAPDIDTCSRTPEPLRRKRMSSQRSATLVWHQHGRSRGRCRNDSQSMDCGAGLRRWLLPSEWALKQQQSKKKG